jgi:radical SAM enzyme (TIGR01210 family)
MCDLWRYTTTEDTPRGAIPAQLDLALSELDLEPDGRSSSVAKLYNAGSFFDPRAVPPDDHEAIAARLAEFDQVVVESHPALVGPAVDRFQEHLGQARLEVAMGLETAHTDALARLHKRMTVEQFRQAADYLKARGISLRVFLLVHPPFIPRPEREEWLARSVELAWECGATVISLIPTRSGNGAMETLREQGLFAASTLSDLERAHAIGMARARGRVLADLWDLERLATCPRCFFDRQERLRQENLRQCGLPALRCDACAGSPA